MFVLCRRALLHSSVLKLSCGRETHSPCAIATELGGVMKFAALGLVLLSTITWAQAPQSKHVWLLTEENHSYEATIGNSTMPYLDRKSVV